MSVGAADLNGNGAPDVLSASLANDMIAWYENQTGTGTADDDQFGPRRVITTAAEWATDVYAVDLDGDGDADVLSASSFDNRIAWYENQIGDPGADSDGFGSQQKITTDADGAQSVYAADLDGDGDKDVLSASANDDKIAWYENQMAENGAGGEDFGAEQTITTNAGSAYSVFAADVDGDGAPDVLSASTFDNTIAWYENEVGEDGADGDGFGAQKTISTDADGAVAVYAVDLDGDSDLDVLSGSSYDDKIAWYENEVGEPGADSDGFGAEHTITTEADYVASVYAADLDADDDVDVLSASRADDRVAWYENQLGEAGADGDGFGDRTTVTTQADEAQSVYAADVNGDKSVDLLSASTNDDKIAWYPNSDGVLPVELVAFEGTLVDADRVELTWHTATETQNARFEVQRRAASEEAGEWRTVSEVTGTGTTTEAQDYEFVDSALPFVDSLSYRLRQIDVDGAAHLGTPITVARDVRRVELRAIFPNPARNHATVRFAVPEPQEVTLRVHDVLGRRMKTIFRERMEGRHQLRVDVSSWPSGTYFLRLTAEGAQRVGRLTVVR